MTPPDLDTRQLAEQTQELLARILERLPDWEKILHPDEYNPDPIEAYAPIALLGVRGDYLTIATCVESNGSEGMAVPIWLVDIPLEKLTAARRRAQKLQGALRERSPERWALETKRKALFALTEELDPAEVSRLAQSIRQRLDQVLADLPSPSLVLDELKDAYAHKGAG